MTEPTAVSLLRDAEAYLSALHVHAARHDHIGADLSCGGCLLQDRIAAALPQLAAVPVPPADQTTDRAAFEAALPSKPRPKADSKAAARAAAPVCKFEEGCHRVVPCDPGCGAPTLRNRIAAAVDEGFRLHAELEDANLGDSITDSVLAVLPEPADRAAILTEAADALDAYIARYRSPSIANWTGAVAFLRRLAGETPAATPEVQPVAGRHETVLYLVQSRESGTEWQDDCNVIITGDLAEAGRELAKRRGLVEGFEFRLAQRTTTVTVQPLPDCIACRHWSCNGDGPCGALLDAWQRCTCTGQPAVGARQDGAQPQARVVQCSRAVLNHSHDAHDWEPQPGMEPVHCPGHRFTKEV